MVTRLYCLVQVQVRIGTDLTVQHVQLVPSILTMVLHPSLAVRTVLLALGLIVVRMNAFNVCQDSTLSLAKRNAIHAWQEHTSWVRCRVPGLGPTPLLPVHSARLVNILLLTVRCPAVLVLLELFSQTAVRRAKRFVYHVLQARHVPMLEVHHQHRAKPDTLPAVVPPAVLRAPLAFIKSKPAAIFVCRVPPELHVPIPPLSLQAYALPAHTLVSVLLPVHHAVPEVISHTAASPFVSHAHPALYVVLAHTLCVLQVL